jgi:hypothetical protein
VSGVEFDLVEGMGCGACRALLAALQAPAKEGDDTFTGQSWTPQHFKENLTLIRCSETFMKVCTDLNVLANPFTRPAAHAQIARRYKRQMFVPALWRRRRAS